MPADSVQPDFNAPRPRGRFTLARPRPVSVWLVFLILFVQGFAVLSFTVADLVVSGTQVLDAVGTVALMVLYVLLGVVLILLGFRLFMGLAGARTPAMLLQLMMVVLSFSFFSGGLVAVGMVFLLPAAVVLVLLFTPPTQAWLNMPDPYAEAEEA